MIRTICNNKKGVRLILLVAYSLLTACHPETDEQKMHATMKKILTDINRGNYNNLPDYMGSDLYKDTFMLNRTARHINYLLSKYHNSNIDSLQWSSPDSVDEIGRRPVYIPLFNGYDSVTGLKSSVIIMHFGPENFVPLNKVSGFEVQKEYDNKHGYKFEF